MENAKAHFENERRRIARVLDKAIGRGTGYLVETVADGSAGSARASCAERRPHEHRDGATPSAPSPGLHQPRRPPGGPGRPFHSAAEGT